MFDWVLNTPLNNHNLSSILTYENSFQDPCSYLLWVSSLPVGQNLTLYGIQRMVLRITLAKKTRKFITLK